MARRIITARIILIVGHHFSHHARMDVHCTAAANGRQHQRPVSWTAGGLPSKEDRGRAHGHHLSRGCGEDWPPGRILRGLTRMRVTPQTLVVDGKRFVILPEEEYARLASQDDSLP